MYKVDQIDTTIGELWHDCIGALHLDDNYRESNQVLLDAAFSKLSDILKMAEEIDIQKENIQYKIKKIRDIL